MPAYETILSKQEQKWISERRVARLSDNKEVQIYPMGAERYLSSILSGTKNDRYNIRAEIEGKKVLVIPGYANSSFLFALSGANSVAAYDKDPITIAWMKAFKKYYHYREENSQEKQFSSIGELLTALTYWYPPLLSLPSGNTGKAIFWLIHPNSLRRVYLHYMLLLVQQAIQSKTKTNHELDKDIRFYVGTVDQILHDNAQTFDTAYVPYLLGVKNGIEREKEIVAFIEQLIKIVPTGHVLVTPSRNTKEFYLFGARYFVTTSFADIQEIPGLHPYVFAEDKHWLRTQGLAVFSSK
ncbi:MAG: ABC transporter permease [Legionella sp.]